MKFPETVFASLLPKMRTPVSSLPPITFPAPGVVPPTNVPVEAVSWTPMSWPRPLTVASSALGPIVFPSTRFPEPDWMSTPLSELPLMTLPAPGTTPPIVLSSEKPLTVIPLPLPTADSPSESIPM